MNILCFSRSLFLFLYIYIYLYCVYIYIYIYILLAHSLFSFSFTLWLKNSTSFWRWSVTVFSSFAKCMYSQRVQPSFSVCQQVRISKRREWGEREGPLTSCHHQPPCFTGGATQRRYLKSKVHKTLIRRRQLQIASGEISSALLRLILCHIRNIALLIQSLCRNLSFDNQEF